MFIDIVQIKWRLSFSNATLSKRFEVVESNWTIVQSHLQKGVYGQITKSKKQTNKLMKQFVNLKQTSVLWNKSTNWWDNETNVETINYI